MKGLFVAGIGTEIGKTVASAALVQAFDAEYWKPVQSGTIDGSDSETISSLTDCTKIHSSGVCLREPLSPHAAAELEDRQISLKDISAPDTQNIVIVEGCGGLLVPLNNTETMADLLKTLSLPTMLVVRHYLGSINHSLLSLYYLYQHNIPLKAIIYSGTSNPSSERVINSFAHVRTFSLPELSELSKASIQLAASSLLEQGILDVDY